MKLRLTILMLAVVATASMLSAQNNKRMAQIRQAYADRLEIMQNKPYDGPFNEIGVDVAGTDDRHLDVMLFHLSPQTVKEGLGCMLGGRVCKGR